MNPMILLLLFALGRGERRDDDRGLDKGLLLALALGGLTGQPPGAPGISPPPPGAPAAPSLDPNVLLLLALGTDLFGPHLGHHRREEVTKLVGDLITKAGLSPGHVNANVAL
jgi:hypothetical protein